eukprot:GEMP01071518.1.p1 GENE.GEMP01071518.1~~GEMP01071518.1.p1  ORF type:complete len:128 (+),score=39.50 GEMP01071518.1:139-522(+)
MPTDVVALAAIAAQKAHKSMLMAKANEVAARRNVDLTSAYASSARAAATLAKTAVLSATEAADRQVAEALGYTPSSLGNSTAAYSTQESNLSFPVVSSLPLAALAASGLFVLPARVRRKQNAHQDFL